MIENAPNKDEDSCARHPKLDRYDLSESSFPRETGALKELCEWAGGMAEIYSSDTPFDSDRPWDGAWRGFEAKVVSPRLGTDLLFRGEDAVTSVSFNLNLRLAFGRPQSTLQVYIDSPLPTDKTLSTDEQRCRFGECYALERCGAELPALKLSYFKGAILGAYLGGHSDLGDLEKLRGRSVAGLEIDPMLEGCLESRRFSIISRIFRAPDAEFEFGDWSRFQVSYLSPIALARDQKPIENLTVGGEAFMARLPIAGDPDSKMQLVLSAARLTLFASSVSSKGQSQLSPIESFSDAESAAEFFRGVIAGYGSAYLAVHPISAVDRISAKLKSAANLSRILLGVLRRK